MSEPLNKQDTKSPPRPRVAARRVLLAEDNPALAQVTRFNLQRAGYEVTAVSDGREAWQAVQQEEFEAVITDEQMPRMTGCELCSRLRTLEAYQQTPVVLLTAKCLELDHDRMQNELGVGRVVGKPFSPQHLIETLGRLLAAADSD